MSWIKYPFIECLFILKFQGNKDAIIFCFFMLKKKKSLLLAYDSINQWKPALFEILYSFRLEVVFYINNDWSRIHPLFYG